MSESGRAWWRATDPKTAIWLYPCSRAQCLEDRRGRVAKHLGMHVAELAGELELLADRRLGDAECPGGWRWLMPVAAIVRTARMRRSRAIPSSRRARRCSPAGS